MHFSTTVLFAFSIGILGTSCLNVFGIREPLLDQVGSLATNTVAKLPDQLTQTKLTDVNSTVPLKSDDLIEKPLVLVGQIVASSEQLTQTALSDVKSPVPLRSDDLIKQPLVLVDQVVASSEQLTQTALSDVKSPAPLKSDDLIEQPLVLIGQVVASSEHLTQTALSDVKSPAPLTIVDLIKQPLVLVDQEVSSLEQLRQAALTDVKSPAPLLSDDRIEKPLVDQVVASSESALATQSLSISNITSQLNDLVDCVSDKIKVTSPLLSTLGPFGAAVQNFLNTLALNIKRFVSLLSLGNPSVGSLSTVLSSIL